MTTRAASLYPGVVLADKFISEIGCGSWATDAALIFGASVVVGLSAHVSVPLPFTPVPITGQTFGVLLTGMVLGKRRGVLAMTLYLLEGAAGMPVFAPSPSVAVGFLRLIGPTAGYLWSFPFVAALVGWLAERKWDRKPHGAAAAMAAGSLAVLTIGSLWLAPFAGGLAAGFEKGFLPFLPGESVKVCAAASLLPWAWALVKQADRNKSE